MDMFPKTSGQAQRDIIKLFSDRGVKAFVGVNVGAIVSTICLVDDTWTWLVIDTSGSGTCENILSISGEPIIV